MALAPRGADRLSVSTSAGVLVGFAAGEGVDAAPLLLVHGGGSDASAVSWYDALARLSDDRRVIALDLPGFGGSIDLEPVGGPDAMADVLAEALAGLGIARAVVCGVSMGGDVALNLALRHPDRVVGLVLVAPGGLASSLGRMAQPAAWLAAQLPDAVLLPMGRFANRFARSVIDRMVADPSRLPDPAMAEFVRLARHLRGALGYARYNQATLGATRMRNDLSDRVAEITVPALFVHGEDDRLVSPSDSRRAVEWMPRAELLALPETGHWAQLERPDEFTAGVRRFLAAHAL